MVTINSIKKGIVIDHITAGLGFKIFNYLKLDTANYTVALIMNAQSSKCGKKDIIKIDNELDIDYEVLGLIDSNITISFINESKVLKKITPKLPKTVENVIICNNPRCASAIESYVPQIFHLIDEKKRQYRCEYCDDIAVSADI